VQFNRRYKKLSCLQKST